MLTYLEFINESADVHYDTFFIKVLSRKSAEEAIEILKKDPTARSFRREEGWEVEDEDNKIIKVRLKSPELRATIERKVKGKHPKIKYTLSGLGDPIADIISTDKQKEQLRFLTKKHFINKEDASDIFIGMYKLFNKENAWTHDYLDEWKQAVDEEYQKLMGTKPEKGGLAPIVILNDEPHNETLIKKGFDIILKAINDGKLDIDPNWIRSLKVVKRFNIF
jgi:hypothetical protein